MPDLRKYLKKYYPVIFLLIVFAVCVDMLAMVWKVAEPLISGNERDEVVAQLEEAFPSAEGNEWVEVVVTPDDGSEYSIYGIVADDTIINFSFVGVGSGRNGDIRILISFNYEVGLGEEFDPADVASQATIVLVYVTRHVETPGIGALIEEPEFIDPFVGLLVEQIGIPPLKIISGASISSEAMIEIVRAEAEDKLAALPSAQDIQAALEAKRAEDAAAEG